MYEFSDPTPWCRPGQTLLGRATPLPRPRVDPLDDGESRSTAGTIKTSPRGTVPTIPYGITERSIEWLGWVLAEVALRGCTSKELFSASGNASHGHSALCTTIDFCICLFVRV